MEISDAELVEKCRAGDRDAFDELFRRHRRQVFTLARFLVRCPEEAADVTQEVFLRAWRALPSLRARDSFGVWVHRIAWNRCQDLLRKPRPGRMGELDDLSMPDDGVPSPESLLISEELRRQVRRAIESLPPIHRAVVVMHHVEGLPLAHIAQVMGVSSGTIMSRLARARETLRRKLAAQVEPEG